MCRWTRVILRKGSSIFWMIMRTSLILTEKAYTGDFKKAGAACKVCPNLVMVDHEELKKLLPLQRKDDPVSLTNPANLAYVMYTSGTTGYPKGVMIEHTNVISLATSNYIRVDSYVVFVQLADIAFDASTFEIWSCLINGARIIIPNNRTELLSNIDLFRVMLLKNRISILWLTKTLFDQLYILDQTIFSSINYLVVGGEALNKELILRLLFSKERPKYIINGYGPTENTVFSTLNIEKMDVENRISVPIGVPLSNRKAYIVDSNSHHCRLEQWGS